MEIENRGLMSKSSGTPDRKPFIFKRFFPYPRESVCEREKGNRYRRSFSYKNIRSDIGYLTDGGVTDELYVRPHPTRRRKNDSRFFHENCQWFITDSTV